MEEWVRKAQQGDTQAFYQLISSYREKLYKTAWYYLRDESAALEAVQEVTCRAFMKIRKLKEPRYFSTWLVRIMINYCMDELKRTHRLVPFEEWTAAEPVHSEDTETAMELDRSVEALEPNYREAIILKYFEDLSVQDIAAVMNRPEGTVKTWISRGLGQLRKMMKGRENYV